VTGAADEVDGRGADGDTVLAVVDATTVGENVDVCAFRTELAVTLGEIFADGLGGGS
jgi:hypothetical protein